MTDTPIPESSFRLRFERKPSPVLPEHRPLYKIGQILLILRLASRGGRSSLPRLHLFNWALKSTARQEILINTSNEGKLSIPAWGFDPVMAIGVRLAIAERLVRENTTGYEITEMGEIFIKEILKDSSLFASERSFLSRVGKRITETMVMAVANSWEI